MPNTDIYNYTNVKIRVETDGSDATIKPKDKSRGHSFTTGREYKVLLFNSMDTKFKRKGTFTFQGQNDNENIDIYKEHVEQYFPAQNKHYQIGTIKKLKS